MKKVYKKMLRLILVNLVCTCWGASFTGYLLKALKSLIFKYKNNEQYNKEKIH
jgi:hypothetical protein